MKNILAIVALVTAATSVSAEAGNHRYGGHGGYAYRGPVAHHHSHRGYWNNGRWVAPLVIGGMIGYELNRPPVTVYTPPQPPAIYVQPSDPLPANCMRYIYQDAYGQTIREEVRCN